MVLFATFAQGQSFGRFGYQYDWTLPALRVDKKGFRAFHPQASTFRFHPPNASWKPVDTSAISQIVATNGSAAKKLRANLLNLGFEVYCDGTLQLKLTDTMAPFLTWSAGGSVGPNVPTAAANWHLISFREEQPPISIGFVEAPAALVIKGKSGDWSLETAEPYTGWIRIAAPNGIRPFRTNSASELGQLLRQCKAYGDELHARSIKVVSTDIDEDAFGIDLNLQLDRSRAVIPASWFLASLGGYSVKISGEPIGTGIATEDGPVMLNSLGSLQVRFPAKRVPLGRYMAIGEGNLPAAATISALHIPSVADLALSLLSFRSEPSVKLAASEAIDEFFESCVYAEEPFTKQKLPYNQQGEGADLLAAHAFLMQCKLNSEASIDTSNALLMSLALRRDWFTGRIWGIDAERSWRASTLAAMAGGFSFDPARRLDGAMFEAGFAGQKGLAVWRRRRNLAAPNESIAEAAPALRDILFGRAAPNAFWKGLTSEMRLVGPRGYSLAKQGANLVLAGSSEDMSLVTFRVFASAPIKLSALENVATLDVGESFGEISVRARLKQAGPFKILIEIPEWAPLPPILTDPPTYTEGAKSRL